MRRRRAVGVFISGLFAIVLLAASMPTLVEKTISEHQQAAPSLSTAKNGNTSEAIDALENLAIKGRAPKTGYARAEFGDGWAKVNGCTTRQIILYRDLEQVVLEDECDVQSGILNDPYTGERIVFSKEKSSNVQIDHVIALSDAWQKGAQLLSKERRIQLANDPLELLAVSGKENQAKSDGDAATWLPKNKYFRCTYIARQIAVKQKYSLWVTQSEYDVMKQILSGCPGQKLPV